MSPKDLTSIAIKIFGIYLMVNVVLYFPSMITTLTAFEHHQEESFSSSVFVTVVVSFILLGLVVSFVLIRLSNSIVSKTAESTESSLTLSQEFVLQVLGIYFIVEVLTVIPGYGISILKVAEIDCATLLYGVGYLFQMVVGCYLLFQPVVWGVAQ